MTAWRAAPGPIFVTGGSLFLPSMTGEVACMDVSEFDFHLPEELIAQSPPPRRTDSRLMVLHRETGELEHRRISDLTEYLRPGNVLVINDTRVRPARLIGMKEETGGRVDILLLKPLGDDRRVIWAKPARGN